MTAGRRAASRRSDGPHTAGEDNVYSHQPLLCGNVAHQVICSALQQELAQRRLVGYRDPVPEMARRSARDAIGQASSSLSGARKQQPEEQSRLSKRIRTSDQTGSDDKLAQSSHTRRARPGSSRAHASVEVVSDRSARPPPLHGEHSSSAQDTQRPAGSNTDGKARLTRRRAAAPQQNRAQQTASSPAVAQDAQIDQDAASQARQLSEASCAAADELQALFVRIEELAMAAEFGVSLTVLARLEQEAGELIRRAEYLAAKTRNDAGKSGQLVATMLAEQARPLSEPLNRATQALRQGRQLFERIQQMEERIQSAAMELRASMSSRESSPASLPPSPTTVPRSHPVVERQAEGDPATAPSPPAPQASSTTASQTTTDTANTLPFNAQTDRQPIQAQHQTSVPTGKASVNVAVDTAQAPQLSSVASQQPRQPMRKVNVNRGVYVSEGESEARRDD